jgi:DNA-binding transcriptional MerR regulator
VTDDVKTNGAGANGQRMSRADVAKHIGVTKGAVRYLESRGELRPTVTGAKGEAWYDRSDVIAFAARRQKRRPGRLTQGAIEAAAMVQFEVHRQRGSLARCVPDVVIATLLPAHEVIRLRDIFARERGVAMPESRPIPNVAEETAREDRRRETERDDFVRALEERRRAVDRELGEGADEDEDEEKDEGVQRRQRRKR